MAFTKNEDAVSPVIGVILMVAITVILAAVIAAFVFGMAGNIQKTKTVAITAQRISSSQVVLTNMGGADVGDLDAVIAITGDVTGSLGTGVGNSVTLGGATESPTHVIATATFADGTKQVLLDTNL